MATGQADRLGKEWLQPSASRRLVGVEVLAGREDRSVTTLVDRAGRSQVRVGQVQVGRSQVQGGQVQAGRSQVQVQVDRGQLGQVQVQVQVKSKWTSHLGAGWCAGELSSHVLAEIPFLAHPEKLES